MIKPDRYFYRNLVSLFDVYDDTSRGRLVHFLSTTLTAMYNCIITGSLYTYYLSIYGLSITDAGILTFIPYIGNFFSIFSSRILANVKRRKPVLLLAKTAYYFLYIVATTVMPLFVTDPHLRMICLGLLLLIAHVLYAPFPPAFNAWFYDYYPRETEDRTCYLALLQIVPAFMSSAVLILSSILVDAAVGDPCRETMILGFRYFAYVLVLLDVFAQSRAKEPTIRVERELTIRQVLTEPFRYSKYIRCLLLVFLFQIVTQINLGLWSYHLLNHLHYSTLLINGLQILFPVFYMLTLRIWRRMLRRYAWVKTFGICCLLYVPLEILFFGLNEGQEPLLWLLQIGGSIINIGINLSYSNLVYLNLPSENTTSNLAFFVLGTNLFSLGGLLLGTWLSSLTGDTPILLLGNPFYSVQLTCLVRIALLLLLGTVSIMKWKSFSNERDIMDVLKQENDLALHRKRRKTDEQTVHTTKTR